MHLLPSDARSLDDEAAAQDLGQSPAELVVLSFSDGDLSAMAGAHGGADHWPSLRLANLNRLKHPYSVDLYVDTVAARASFVLVRLLGGMDYWRYGVEQLAAAARRHHFHLAVVPGCEREDRRLDEASTLSPEDLRRIWAWFREGGPDNLNQVLRYAGGRLGRDFTWAEPRPLPAAGLHPPLCRPLDAAAPHVLIVFYRSALMVGDVAPVEALADALHARAMRVTSFYVSSLKDEASAATLRDVIAADPPDVILNTTAFSARREGEGSVLDGADVPVFQVVQAGAAREAWEGSSRGLGAADLAMNVVLPETDGRILAGAVSFKGQGLVLRRDLLMKPPHPEPVEGSRWFPETRFPLLRQAQDEEIKEPQAYERADDAVERAREAFEFTPLSHRPDAAGVAHAADLALAWLRLRRTPRAERRIACMLSDYPGKAGRGAYAVGLDTPASLMTIADRLKREGFSVGDLPEAAALMAQLTTGEPKPVLSLAAYERGLARLPAAFADSVRTAWGDAASDASLRDGFFAYRIVEAGRLVVAIQPDRGRSTDRRANYHDATLPPRHGYVAFYLWLRETLSIHAMVHLGTHGTLEWLPGKALALSEACGPQAVLGPVPLIYPFIVNNPGEAAQAKRRAAAVTVGHLTPPLVEAGSHGVTAELEALFDEYAEAEGLDRRRARLLAEAIFDKARDTGLAAECGIEPEADPQAALVRLDAWLCDLKEARIGDGLHVFGAPSSALSGTFSPQGRRELMPPDCPSPPWGEGVARSVTDEENLRAACGEAELQGLLKALDGAFVPPGPSGSPARGRRDVLPTGRNLFAVDPRAVPTRTAYEIGRRAAAELMTRYAQDHGDWPRSLVLDLWGSATMRTGGDDLAQAFALIGARPVWDGGSTRVSGYEIIPLARLDRPRVDVTLRISGLFRDVFPEQIALFDAAARAVSQLDEADADNALAEARRSAPDNSFFRVFGAAPNVYGLEISDRLTRGDWRTSEELGRIYLETTSHAYAGHAAEPREAALAFRTRVGAADAYLHVADLPETDILSSDIHAEHQGGFAAAAASLGKAPALYHADATRPDRTTIRSLPEEIARVLRARATNPRWLRGQMRHGFRGAAEIAESVDALFGFAATTGAVPSRHFDLLFDAVLGDEAVRAFLHQSNPAAARAIADKFHEAAQRGFWATRRNSSAALLADLRAEA